MSIILNLELLEQVKLSQEKVGQYQLEFFRQAPPGGGNEKERREFVSEIDVNSEMELKKHLEILIPQCGFLGEETGGSGSVANYWVVDPLDGTTNYLSGIDQFSISIALVVQGEPVLGSIYRPASNEFFCALRGQGAWHKQKKLKKQGPYPLKSALIGTGFPYRSPQLQDNFFGCAKEVLNVSRGIRRFGSAALDISYVAGGYLQGFWETDLKPYDVGAALVLLEETGCFYSAFGQSRYDFLQDRSLVVGPPGVYGELKAIVDKHYPPYP